MTTRPLVLFAALALFGASTPAAADPAPADPRAEARAHFKRGQEHQEAGRYDEAIAEYLAAYRVAPMPALLFNLGQAYRLKGDKRRAVAYYRKYVAAEPNAGPSIEAQQHINVLSAAVLAEDEVAAETDPPVELPGGDTGANDRPAGGKDRRSEGKDEAAKDRRLAAAAAGGGDQDPEPAARIESKSTRAGAASRSRVAAKLRADFALVAAGLSFRLARFLEVELDALVGTQLGGYAGASIFLWGRSWRPMILAGGAVLTKDGVTAAAAHGALGLRWEPTPRFALFAAAGAFWFPSDPPGWKSLVFVPSAGLQLNF